MVRLTSKEEEILGYFWTKGPLFVRELLDLQEEPRPHYNTLSTIVRSLEERDISDTRCMAIHTNIMHWYRKTITGVIP